MVALEECCIHIQDWAAAAEGDNEIEVEEADNPDNYSYIVVAVVEEDIHSSYHMEVGVGVDIRSLVVAVDRVLDRGACCSCNSYCTVHIPDFRI